MVKYVYPDTPGAPIMKIKLTDYLPHASKHMISAYSDGRIIADDNLLDGL